MKTKQADAPTLTETEQRILTLKAASDPLGVSSVLLRMAERGWPSKAHVKSLTFSQADAPSLAAIEEALGILTALRDEVKAAA